MVASSHLDLGDADTARDLLERSLPGLPPEHVAGHGLAAGTAAIVGRDLSWNDWRRQA